MSEKHSFAYEKERDNPYNIWTRAKCICKNEGIRLDCPQDLNYLPRHRQESLS